MTQYIPCRKHVNVSFCRSTGLSDVGLVIALVPKLHIPEDEGLRCRTYRLQLFAARVAQVLCGVKRLPVLAKCTSLKEKPIV